MQRCASRVIVITGSMGAGKTTTMAEASDLLDERGIPHAAIDFDALGLAHMAGQARNDLMFRNRDAVCANYAAAGIDRFVIAAAVESRADLDRIRAATAAGAMVVCRLVAPVTVMEQRVAVRECRGIRASQYVAGMRILNDMLDAAALEDLNIETERPVTTVAQEMLFLAGWLEP
jgi:adenylylsulfate kinase-like enzyme